MKILLFAFTVLLNFNLVFAQADSGAVLVERDVEFTSVQVEAQFPGGLPAWRKYLETNLNVQLADSCLTIPKGKKSVRQTVIVSFRVDKNGKITDVKADNAKTVHPALAQEAIRVIRNGPDWIPAELNGKKVIYRQRQNITWVLEE